MKRFIRELEFDADATAELMIHQMEKANDLLTAVGNQIAIAQIEPEFKRYFKPSDKDDSMGLGDKIDLRVAIDILENPDRYISGAFR